MLAWLHWTQALFGKEQAEVGFTVVGLLTIVPGAVFVTGVLTSPPRPAPLLLIYLSPNRHDANGKQTNTHTGAYHSWIALCVWLGVEGYRWSDIPSYG